MVDAFGLTLLLLPVAAASGWLAARRSRPAVRASGGRAVSTDYLKGLNYLVNEDADKAIEVFVRLLEVDNETVETHLALGNLFRRRGEVDRALRIHQNLVARPNLEVVHRDQARFELAKDYLRAGVLDRAENLFLDLVSQGVFPAACLRHLITIFEKERDWNRAIEMTRRLESASGRSLAPAIAHYHCELANGLLQGDDWRSARKMIKCALTEDRKCVRASLLRGRLLEGRGRLRAAVKAYSRVLRQNAEFLTEALPPLERCFRKLDALEDWRAFLVQAGQHYPGAVPHVAMARLLNEQGDAEAGITYLSEYLQHQPSWLGFYHLLDLAWSQSQAGLSGPLDSLREALHHMVDTAGRYQCTQCGFSGRQLHWQCPGCHHWNSVRPLKDIASPAP